MFWHGQYVILCIMATAGKCNDFLTIIVSYFGMQQLLLFLTMYLCDKRHEYFRMKMLIFKSNKRRQNDSETFSSCTRGICVTEDSNDTHPGSHTDIRTRTTTSLERVSSGPSSVLFQSAQEGCLVSPPSQNLGPLGSLTLALWTKPSAPGEM